MASSQNLVCKISKTFSGRICITIEYTTSILVLMAKVSLAVLLMQQAKLILAFICC